MRLLISSAADVNKRSVHNDGSTPLMTAASAGYSNIVGLLVSAGARHGSFRELVAAVKAGIVDDVVRLIAAGVSVNRTSDDTVR